VKKEEKRSYKASMYLRQSYSQKITGYREGARESGAGRRANIGQKKKRGHTTGRTFDLKGEQYSSLDGYRREKIGHENYKFQTG